MCDVFCENFIHMCDVFCSYSSLLLLNSWILPKLPPNFMPCFFFLSLSFLLPPKSSWDCSRAQRRGPPLEYASLQRGSPLRKVTPFSRQLSRDSGVAPVSLLEC